MMPCLLAAAALLVWPLRMRLGQPARVDSVPGPGRQRLVSGSRARLRLLVAPSAVAVALGGYAVAGMAGLLACAAAVATGGLLVHRAVAERRRRIDLTDILSGLRMLARELRAGADPTAAAVNAAAAARGEGGRVLLDLAHLTRSDGSQTLGPPGETARAQTIERLRHGYDLTRRHGLAFTPLVDALAADLAEQLAADAERAGQVAGPRMSGYVMAGLPVMGLALGVGMGADPLRVLLTTPIGNVLLLVGVALTCAGLLWSARIVRRS